MITIASSLWHQICLMAWEELCVTNRDMRSSFPKGRNKAFIGVMKKVGLKFEKEFVFTESQLPNLQPFERKAVKYSLNKEEFKNF